MMYLPLDICVILDIEINPNMSLGEVATSGTPGGNEHRPDHAKVSLLTGLWVDLGILKLKFLRDAELGCVPRDNVSYI